MNDPSDLRNRRAEAEAALPEATKAAIRRMDRFADQDEAGVDLSLIRENLRLRPTERVERNWRRRQEALELRDHARRIK